MKRILVNIPTTHKNEIFPPWLRILRKFQAHGCEIFLNAGPIVKKLGFIKDIDNFRWLNKDEERIIKTDIVQTKFGFLLHSLIRNFQVMRNASKIYSNVNFDIIYTPSSVLDFVIFPFFLKLTKREIKWVSTLANIVPLTDPGNRISRFVTWIFFHISLFMLKQADLIFASTPEIKEYLLSNGYCSKKVILTGFGIESDMINNATPSKDYQIDALFAGRINETKGIYDMLKVLKIIRGKYPKFKLAIMGEGDKYTKERFIKKIKNLKLEDSVQFLGYKSGIEKYNIIKSAKCFLFLSVSKSESFGIALLEAVCSGIPCFAYSLQQYSWIYSNGEVDITTKGDYVTVANKILKLFDMGNFINENGKKLLRKYSWEKVADIEFENINNLR